MTSPQERREALFGCYWRGTADDATDKASALVESWLAEKDAEIERLRALVRIADEFAREEYQRGLHDGARDRADERRRTAELIIARLEENERWLNDEIVTDDGFAQQVGRSVLADMRSLAREIGDSDDQQ